jgi:hypothetical protein
MADQQHRESDSAPNRARARTSSGSDTTSGGGGDGDGDTTKAEVLRQLFGDVGDHVDDFTCAVQSNIILHGRMYVTTKFICFYSNLFGLEKKIRIPYSHITAVTKENTAFVIPNAIAITSYRKEYLFRSFWDRDDCYKLLKDYISKGKPGAGIEDKVQMSPEVVEEHDPLDFIALSPHAPPKATNRRTNTPSVRLSQRNAQVAEDEVETEVGRKEFSEQMHEDEATENYEAALEQEVSKCKMKIMIKKEILNISVDAFYDAFVADDAVFSWKRHHEEHGDKDVQVIPWTYVSKALGFTREFKFFKPVNLPGVAKTRAKKVQRYRRFGDAGLLLCSSTLVEDVPAADTFSVEDVCVVRSLDAGRISVELGFEVKFVKNTMLKFLIESNTNSEMSKWMEEFSKVLIKVSSLFYEY